MRDHHDDSEPFGMVLDGGDKVTPQVSREKREHERISGRVGSTVGRGGTGGGTGRETEAKGE